MNMFLECDWLQLSSLFHEGVALKVELLKLLMHKNFLSLLSISDVLNKTGSLLKKFLEVSVLQRKNLYNI